jgi:hypothetical protein
LWTATFVQPLIFYFKAAIEQRYFRLLYGAPA